jgi:cytochrome P450
MSSACERESSGTAGAFPTLEQARCPYPLYRELRDERCPVACSDRGEYLVSRHEDVTFALRHPEIFSSDVGAGGPRENAGGYLAMLNSDPPEHAAKRRLAFEPFRPGRMKAQIPMIERVVDGLIDDFADAGEVDFNARFAVPLPIIVTARLMGLPPADYEQIRDWSTLEGSGTVYLPEDRRHAEVAKDGRMVAYITQLLADRRERPGDDVLSEMIAAQIERDGEYDEVALTAEAAVLLLGGIVTTAHMICSALLLLLRNPERMAGIRADPARIPALLEESLRLESPVQWRPRRCTVETELGGVTIPAGSRVLLLLAAANRDERKFDAPDAFDETRDNVKQHTAFGLGAHFCLGAPLARLEGRIAFERLLGRLDEIRLAVPAEQIDPIPSVLFRAPSRLPITFRAAA